MNRLARTLDQPPQGRCATCQHEATKWVGRIDALADGREVRRSVGVCDDCYTRLTSDPSPTLDGCGATTAASPSQSGELPAQPI